MKKDISESIEALLHTEDRQIADLHKIVADSMKEEKLVSHKLRHDLLKIPSFGERLADRVASFGGSWRFILIFSGLLVLWIAVNTYFLSQEAFDPYPFILLNLILSCIAAMQAPIIMMSQNRQEAKDRKRSEHDYVINLKAEIEIRALHQKVDMLILEQMKALLDSQRKQLEYLEELQKR